MVGDPIDVDKILAKNELYERKRLVKAMGTLEDLLEYTETLSKDINNPDARKKLGYLLRRDPAAYANMSPDLMRNEADEFRDNMIRNIGGTLDESGKVVKGYVENNFDTLLGELTPQQLHSLIHNLPLYRTEDDGLNEIIDAIAEVKKIQQMREKGEGIEEYVSKKMEKMPEWAHRAFFGYGGANQNYVMQYFETFANKAQEKLGKLITTEEKGKRVLDEGRLRTLLVESLDVARDELDEERDKGTNYGVMTDIYEKCIRPYYTTIAQTLYKPKKKEQKEADDPEREKRKAERGKLGMSE